jgi:ribosomal protein S30
MNLGQRKREVLRIHKENKQIVGRLQNIKSEFEKIEAKETKNYTDREKISPKV